MKVIVDGVEHEIKTLKELDEVKKLHKNHNVDKALFLSFRLFSMSPDLPNQSSNMSFPLQPNTPRITNMSRLNAKPR